MNKLPIFLRLYHRQRRAIEDVRKWLTQSKGRLKWQRAEREIFWQNQPEEAFQLWQQHFQALYLSLVNYMQLLTGAMSGPVNILDRLNLLTKLSGALKEKSASTNYLSAFNDLKGGHISRDVFLRQFGHRGFYESDLGQARFGDFDDEDWWQLLGRSDQQAGVPEMPLNKPLQTPKSAWPWVLGRVIRLIHMREELRHETMKFFWPFRQELQEHSKYHLGPDIDCWQYRPQDLSKLFAGELLPADPTPGSSGWDMDTFLHNRLGRRLPIDLFMGHKEALPAHAGIGIYPGQVSGQVWRVAQAGLSQLHRPDFQSIILVADALDPGWIPFFTGVDGVISYTGGLLSHASIILRESGIPAITQLPAHLELQTGDWIEMDGQTGEVKVFSRENDPVNQL